MPFSKTDMVIAAAKSSALPDSWCLQLRPQNSSDMRNACSGMPSF